MGPTTRRARTRARAGAGVALVPLLALAVVVPSATTVAASLDASQQSAVAAPALAFAHDQLGKPYEWGATGPAAYDCSGLVYAAYQAAGIRLPRTSQTMYDRLPHVRRSNLQPGDLVFFGTLTTPPPPPSPTPTPTPTPTSTGTPTASPTPTTSPTVTPTPSPSSSPMPSPSPSPTSTAATVHHVGIYLGNGQMLDSPKSGDVVKVESMLRSDVLPLGARPARRLALPVRRGDGGFTVLQVQRLLSVRYDVSVDGVFGRATGDAIRRFQTAHGLDATGVVGWRTWTTLVKVFGRRAAAAIGNAPDPPPAGSTEREQMVAPYRDTTLREGDTGKAVKVLQQLLGGLTVDGDFGPKTKASVNAFKSAHGLDPNGVVGTKTWDALAEG